MYNVQRSMYNVQCTMYNVYLADVVVGWKHQVMLHSADFNFKLVHAVIRSLPEINNIRGRGKEGKTEMTSSSMKLYQL